MPSNDASTSRTTAWGDRLRPWVPLILWACLLAFFAGFVTYVVVRLRVTYGIERQMILLQHHQDEIRLELDSLYQVSTDRLDMMERVVFGEVEPRLREQENKTPTRPRVVVEPWTANRARDLDRRVTRLERLLMFGRQDDPPQ